MEDQEIVITHNGLALIKSARLQWFEELVPSAVSPYRDWREMFQSREDEE